MGLFGRIFGFLARRKKDCPQGMSEAEYAEREEFLGVISKWQSLHLDTTNRQPKKRCERCRSKDTVASWAFRHPEYNRLPVIVRSCNVCDYEWHERPHYARLSSDPCGEKYHERVIFEAAKHDCRYLGLSPFRKSCFKGMNWDKDEKEIIVASPLMIRRINASILRQGSK